MLLSQVTLLLIGTTEWVTATQYTNHVTTSIDEPYNFILNMGDAIYSTEGNTGLIMQRDGNFVLYHNGSALWDSQTHDIGGLYAEITRSGNILVIHETGSTLWQSDTGDHIDTSPHHLIVDESCAYLMDQTNQVLWNKGSGCAAPYPTIRPPPTELPTIGPTQPSEAPTSTTFNPTDSPSKRTENPTSQTHNPSLSTISPTANPSNEPSASPTINPLLNTTSSPVDDPQTSTTNYGTEEGEVQDVATTTDDEFEWLTHLFITVICIVSVVSLVCLLYCIPKLRKQIKVNEIKEQEKNDNQVVADMENDNETAIEPNPPCDRVKSKSIDSSDDSAQEPEGMKEVTQWLTNDVGLPQYSSILVHNGFESMRIIQAIDSVDELMETGIMNKEHVTAIMAEINKLKLRSMTMSAQGSMLAMVPPRSLSYGAGIQHDDINSDSDEKVVEDIAMDKSVYTKGNGDANHDEGDDYDDEDVDVVDDIVVKQHALGSKFATKGK